MNIDINKIFALDLRNKNGKRFSNTRVQFIADYLKIDGDFLVELHEKYNKIWFISIDGYTHLVYALVGDVSMYSFGFNLTDAEADTVKAMTSVEVPSTPAQTKKVKVAKTNEVKIDEVSNIFIEDLIGDFELDVDTILDKISDNGVSSLTKRELEFLNNLNK